MPTDFNSRLWEEFSLLYECPIDFFNTPGTFIRTRESLAGRNQIYLTRYLDWSFLTVAPETEERLRDTFDVSRTFTADNLPGAFGGPGKLEDRLHGLLLPENAKPRGETASGYHLKEHDPSDHPLLKSFLSRCTPEEIDDADIDLDDPDDAIVLVMCKDQPVVYSGYRILRKNLGDMGILVLADHRRKGLAVAALTRSIAICRERGYIPLYRHWESNPKSAAVAARLGFQRTYTVNVYAPVS